MWWVYIIDKGDKYYTGITTDLDKRLGQHKVKMFLYKQQFSNKIEAAKREREVKGWTRRKKQRLIAKFSREFTLRSFSLHSR